MERGPVNPRASRAVSARANRSSSSRIARNSTRLPRGTGCTTRSPRTSICSSMPPQPRSASNVARRNGSHSCRSTPRASRDSRIDSRGLIPCSSSRFSSTARPAQPAVGRPTGLPVQLAERAIEALRPMRQRPGRQTLVEECRAEPDEHGMDQGVGILAGGFQQQVPMPHGGRGRRRVGRQVPDPVAADPPQRLERERFPIVVAPVLDPRLAEPDEQLGQAGGDRLPGRSMGRAVSAFVAAPQVAHHPSTRLGDQACADGRRDLRPHPTQGVGLGHVPEQFLRRADPQRILEHRQPQLEPRPEAGDRPSRTFPQVLLQHLLQFRESDPAPPQLLAIAVLAQVHLAAEDPGGFLERLMERQVFEGVQGVVVDEDGDRPLRGQEVGRAFDHRGQLLDVRTRFLHTRAGAFGSYGRFHGDRSARKKKRPARQGLQSAPGRGEWPSHHRQTCPAGAIACSAFPGCRLGIPEVTLAGCKDSSIDTWWIVPRQGPDDEIGAGQAMGNVRVTTLAISM